MTMVLPHYFAWRLQVVEKQRWEAMTFDLTRHEWRLQ